MSIGTASPPAHEAGRREIRSLQGLRFLAAFGVLLFHNTAAYQSHLPNPIHRLVNMGDLGVSLFFVLSGFVLCYVYGARAANDVRGFLMARLARVYPVYLIGLFLALPVWARYELSAVPDADLLGEIVRVGIANLTLTQAWLPSAACDWNCPGWSLSVEAFFYLSFPVLAVLLVRRSNRGLIAIGVAALLLSFLATWLYRFLAPRLYPDDSASALMVGAVPLLRLPEFVIGIVIGLLHVRGVRFPRPELTVVGIGVLLLGLPLTGLVGPAAVYRAPLFLPLFALLVMALAAERGALVRALQTPLMVELGRASYVLYLVHASLFPLVRWYAWDPGARAAGTGYAGVVVFFLAYILFAVGLSVAVFRWVEEPARKALRAWYTRRRSTVAEVGVA